MRVHTRTHARRQALSHTCHHKHVLAHRAQVGTHLHFEGEGDPRSVFSYPEKATLNDPIPNTIAMPHAFPAPVLLDMTSRSFDYVVRLGLGMTTPELLEACTQKRSGCTSRAVPLGIECRECTIKFATTMETRASPPKAWKN